MQRKALLSYLILIYLLILSCKTCTNDPGCDQCAVYVIPLAFMTGLVFEYCEKCFANQTFEIQTQICQCNSSYYRTTPGKCEKCPQICLQCTSQTQCTQCSPAYNRVLINGRCECFDGYQQKNGDKVCTKKANILVLILSTIGSILCVISSFALCWFLRMRRTGIQIHTQYPNPNNMNMNMNGNQLPPQALGQSSYDSTLHNGGMTTSSFWNAKQYNFKYGQLCSICLDCQPLFMTSCGHYFHSKCIYSWLEGRNTCPNCNKEMDGKQVKRWCERCKKVLMPVVSNVIIRKKGTKKRQLIKSTPVQHQICDQCQISMNGHQIDQKQLQQDPNQIFK